MREASLFVQQLVQEIAQLDRLPATETRFLEAGMDSLMIVDLSARVGVETGQGRDVPATLVFDYPTIGDLARFLLQTLCPDPAGPPDSPTASVQPADSQHVDRSAIERMSEEQALQELMRELEN